MLGEQIGVFEGKITAQRVLPSDGGPKLETTAEASGKILGIGARVIATYWTVMLPDGSLYGETTGPCPTIAENGDMGAYRGSGAGRMTGKGNAASFRGAVYFQGGTGKLALLNGRCLVHEWDVDEKGNGRFSLWEWK